jgi:cyanuric acid amidohydrolase
MPMARVHRIATTGPDDVSGLKALIAAGGVDPKGIVAILGKTEGNGCVNDFTCAFAVSELKRLMSDHLPAQEAAKIAYVMSGGTEGALSPHILVFERDDTDGPGPALAIGGAITPDIAPQDIGTQAQIETVAAGVRTAMQAAGISDPAHVHFVQIKCPLLTADRIAAAEAQGHATATRDTLKSMGLSRGASALGVALALGEIDPAGIANAKIGTDTALWSSRASTSAGVELMGHEIVVMGMSDHWAGDLIIDHAVMQDGIDTDPVRAALHRLGIDTAGQVPADQRQNIVALLAKADPGSTGQTRGLRHTMLDDSDLSATRHARAFTGGALAALTGRTDLFISGGAEHQGPDGGGPVAIIAKRQGAAA